MTSDILDAIDSAVQDWETSRDAMRSRPGGFGEEVTEADCWTVAYAMARAFGAEMSELLPDGYRLIWEQFAHEHTT